MIDRESLIIIRVVECKGINRRGTPATVSEIVVFRGMAVQGMFPSHASDVSDLTDGGRRDQKCIRSWHFHGWYQYRDGVLWIICAGWSESLKKGKEVAIIKSLALVGSNLAFRVLSQIGCALMK